MPVAEETGLIVPIGEWVIRTACKQMKEWQQLGIPFGKVSINLSARQFIDASLLSFLSKILTETKVEPSLIELEITESISMYSVESAIKPLTAIRSLGFSVSVDDFGTGQRLCGCSR